MLSEVLTHRQGKRPPSISSNFIIRCDGLRVAGWQVRIPPWHPQGPSTKLFSDSVYGGTRAAKKEAQAYRDGIFKSANLAVPKTKKFHSHHSTNATGLVGVTFSRHHNVGRNGQTKDPDTGYLYWTAFWSNGNTQHKKNFSVSKFGFVGAWQLAVKLRQTKTGGCFSQQQLDQGLTRCQELYRHLSAKGIQYPAVVEMAAVPN